MERRMTLPKDQPADDARVDDWDEADDGAAKRATPPANEPVTASPAPAIDTETATLDTPPDLPWREVLRNTPLWVWLISTSALFGICAMFVVVMLLIAIGK